MGMIKTITFEIPKLIIRHETKIKIKKTGRNSGTISIEEPQASQLIGKHNLK